MLRFILGKYRGMRNFVNACVFRATAPAFWSIDL
jgi:hypothetical protein